MCLPAGCQANAPVGYRRWSNDSDVRAKIASACRIPGCTVVELGRRRLANGRKGIPVDVVNAVLGEGRAFFGK